jgi:signal transduction histidine kinase/AraC-like DNA-binding protein
MQRTDHHGSPTIGVLAGWQFYRTATNLSYLAPVFRGISRAAQNLGCNLLFGCGIGPSASPADPLRPAWPDILPEVDFVPIGPWNTDGLLVANPLHSQARSAYIQGLISQGHPVLFIGSGEKGPTIVADNIGGIEEAMRHLAGHGHRQIAFIAGPREDMGGDSGDRLAAYRSFVDSNNLEYSPLRIAFGRHVYDGGYSAMKKILDSGVPFTAVLASNDESALGAMQALEEAGRRVPQDAAIIGFDNRLEGAVHEPGLSSVHIPLFDLGYQALKLMCEHLTGRVELGGTLKVDTRLVKRGSCGCSPETNLPSRNEVNTKHQLIDAMRAVILNQAHRLTREEGHLLCEQLVDAFAVSLQQGDGSKFLNTLEDVLQRSMKGEDDAHIWQQAVSLLGIADWHDLASPNLVHQILDAARLSISTHIQHQYRKYVIDERWSSSRMSLLTDRLLDALDESQILETLAEHLPELGIRTARLVLFETEGADPVAWSVLHDVITPDQAKVRFRSREFPPPVIFDEGAPFQLTLIPLVGHSGQMGYLVFGSEPQDVYGAIVQQLGGAFNTTRLYRQAVEDRQLAEEANRMKSRFLSTISHELRTPLNLIVGLSGILLQEDEDGKSTLSAPAQRDVERIHAYAQHLGGLIGDVLDLATSDAGQLRLNMDFIDLGEALRVIAESGRQLASDKRLEWHASIPETGPWVWGDRTRLRQVALNLVNNAIKFTESGEVSFRVEIGDGMVTVRVHDTGLGIPAEEQVTIFSEFHRSERSIALGYGGLGLGLAICKRLVEMHGGTIGVHSSGEESAGSTFTFTLPTVPPPAESDSSHTRTGASEKIVMVLTHRPEASEPLCEQLKQQAIQVEVLTFEPSSHWQTRISELIPDALLVDAAGASDPDWNILAALHDHPLAREIPLIFYTASQQKAAVQNLEYLTKPIEPNELTRALDQQQLPDMRGKTVRTILVVDDDQNTMDLHARIVQSHSSSNRVLKAHNGREALELLSQETIDLVLLDLQMPELDGFDVLEAMRENERTHGVPVIVVTGKVLTEEEMARLTRGVTAVLQKGLFSLDETVEHIRAALERKPRLSGEAQRLVRKAMAYIHEHFPEPISRRDIARHVSIAEDYLTYCFRQELGTTPIKYLQRYRVNRARSLLRRDENTITEIARMVGFSDSGYFSRIFHRETGMSPESFRRS